MKKGKMLAKGPWFEIRAAGDVTDVFIFGEIGWEVSAQSFADTLAQYPGKPLNVRINSLGGSVMEGLAIYNMLKSKPETVTCTVEGFAVSMGSVIAMAGDNVEMQKASMMMLHAPSGNTFGNADEMRQMAMTLDQIKSVMVGIYADRSGQTPATVEGWMAEGDKWFTAEEALAAGLCDTVLDYSIDMEKAAASLDVDKYSNVPENIRTLKGAAVKTTATNVAADAAKVEANKMADDEKKSVSDNKADVTAIALGAVRAERERVSSITASFGLHEGFEDIRAACILEGVSVEDANTRLLAAISAKAKATPSGSRAVVIEDALDKFKEGALSAIMARANPTSGEAREMRGKNEFFGMSLLDLARHSLQLANVSMRGMDRMAIVGQTFTLGSSAFSTILRDAANKSLLEAYDGEPEIYTEAAKMVSIPDFKTMYFANLGAFSGLDKIAETDQYKLGDFGQFGQSAVLSTFGKLFNISRQSIINDDLGAFTRIPALMGESAKRNNGDLFANVFINNAAMDEDSVTLFHASHGNLIATAAPSSTQFDAMAVLMAKQKAPAPKGVASAATQYLNLMPRIVLVPQAYRNAAIQVAESSTEIASAQNNSMRPNPISKYGLKVLADARFDAAAATTYYMITEPARGNAVIMGFLDGVDTPTLEQENLFNVDGLAFKVRQDAVAAAINYRHFVRAA